QHRNCSFGIAAWADAAVCRRAKFQWSITLLTLHRCPAATARYAAQAAVSRPPALPKPAKPERPPAISIAQVRRNCPVGCGTGRTLPLLRRCTCRGEQRLRWFHLCRDRPVAAASAQCSHCTGAPVTLPL